MAITELDSIRALIETNLLGSTVLLVGAALVLPFVMLLVGRIPPFFTFLILSPAFLAFGQAGLLPQWIVAGTWIVYAKEPDAIKIRNTWPELWEEYLQKGKEEQ